MLEEGEKDLRESFCMLKTESGAKGKKGITVRNASFAGYLLDSPMDSAMEEGDRARGATTPTQGFISEQNSSWEHCQVPE